MSSESYLKRLFKSHGWDKDIKFLSDFSDSLQNATDSDLDQLGIPATSVAEAINSLEEISDTSPVSPFQDVMNVSKVKPTSDPSGNTPPSITVPESKKITSTGTKPLWHQCPPIASIKCTQKKDFEKILLLISLLKGTMDLDIKIY